MVVHGSAAAFVSLLGSLPALNSLYASSCFELGSFDECRGFQCKVKRGRPQPYFAVAYNVGGSCFCGARCLDWVQ